MSKTFRQPRSLALIRSFRVALLTFMFGLSSVASADPFVRVSTSMGDYTIQLYESIAPVTVENFLNYVNRDAYNNTYLHRVVRDFVVQGGGYGFQLFVGPVDIATDAPIINEFNVSNTRGTVAMAKLASDPNSATSQWFVNVSNNRADLDTTNGGFTVFGQVLGNGMDVIDAINDLPQVNLGGPKAAETPYFTPTYQSPLNFVYQNVEVVGGFSEAIHVYVDKSGLLISRVNIDNGDQLISLNFNRVFDEPGIVLQANLDTVIPVRDAIEGMATFSYGDNRLRIPSLEVDYGDRVEVVNNVVLVLTNTELSYFTVESYDE